VRAALERVLTQSRDEQSSIDESFRMLAEALS
jgi:hypothetical protein